MKTILKNNIINDDNTTEKQYLNLDSPQGRSRIIDWHSTYLQTTGLNHINNANSY